MTTDGGGWTLVLNYLHQGTTNPDTLIRNTDLPIQNSITLGGNESASTGVAGSWGHASNSMMNALEFTEVRFYGITSGPSNIIDFKTSHAGTMSYFKTGLGSCNGIQSDNTHLASHTANLPDNSDSFMSNQGEGAMTVFPFFRSSNEHWGIDATSGSPDRWEVDDFALGPVNNTLHQIWVK